MDSLVVNVSDPLQMNNPFNIKIRDLESNIYGSILFHESEEGMEGKSQKFIVEAKSTNISDGQLCQNDNLTYKVFTLSGRLVYISKDNSYVDLKNILSPGLYILEFNNKKSKIIIK